MATTADIPTNVDLETMRDSFHRHGYAVVRSLFADKDVDEIKKTFDRIAANGPIPGHFDAVPHDQSGGDPLKEYPRVHHPHRFDAVSRRALLHPGVLRCVRELTGEEVLAAQSMFYFKPPGARGQAMHQDNFYLMVEPQTCVAAWTAIDNVDPENGGLYLIDDTANEPIVCPGTADPSLSFTTHLVPIPEGKKAVPCMLNSGDTLFFNGSTIHGSGPNRSEDRFRRSFVCHYVPRSTRRISRFYLPLLDPDGNEVMIEPNAGGGACGRDWMEDVVWEGSAH
jgi:ectoine hydroxylase-related dioxygenase (phytanoyl-CoA dioxygenase family)